MTHGIHKGLTPMQRQRVDSDRRYLATVTDAAYLRMRERTAREQLLAAQRELERELDDVVPVVPDDADDSSWTNKFA